MSCFSKQDVSFKVLMAQLKSPEELHYSGLSLGDPMMGRGQDPTYAYLRYILHNMNMKTLLNLVTSKSRRSPRVKRLLALPPLALLPSDRLAPPQPDQLTGALTTPHARGSTHVDATIRFIVETSLKQCEQIQCSVPSWNCPPCLSIFWLLF